MNSGRYRGPLHRVLQLLIRLSGRNLAAHAIIPDPAMQRVLVLQSRLDGSWGFPGGGVKHGESIADAVTRECHEELGVGVSVEFLSGIYYTPGLDSHSIVFRCSLTEAPIRLSAEHSACRFIEVSALPSVEQIRALDALEYDGHVRVRTLASPGAGHTGSPG